MVSVYNLLLLPNDPAEEAVNMIMYDWGLDVKSLMSNQTTYLSLLTQLKNDADYTLSFQDLQITTAIAQFTGPDGVIYEPYLWLYNGKSITINEELPAQCLCIGTDVDGTLALGSGYSVEDDDQIIDDEFIAGWNFATNCSPEVINEEEADTMEAPLIIVMFSEQGIEPDNSSTVRKTQVNHPVDPVPSFKRYWLKSLMMDVRNERGTPRSEVRLIYHLVINNDLKEPPLQTPVLKIHKKHLGSWRGCSFPVLWGTPTTFGIAWEAIAETDDVKIFGVVYEYDWWAIKKPISITSQDPNSANSITIRFKAKYSSDNYEIYREEDLTYLTNGDYYIGSHSKLYQDL